MSTRQQAAQRAATIINDAERAMDAALAAASRLVTELPALQAEAGLNAAWAQPAVAGVCAALGDLTTARASLIGAHRSMSAVARRLGVATAEVPNNSKDDDDKRRTTGAHDDRQVVQLRSA